MDPCSCSNRKDVRAGGEVREKVMKHDKHERCCDDVPTCSPHLNVRGFEEGKKPRAPAGKCPREDYLARLEFSDQPEEIQRILQQVENGGITTSAEFIFSLRHYVQDRGKILIEILERDLAFFRKLVDKVVDSRVQDESDVMHCTLRSIKEKFSRLTQSMNDRSSRIKKRLYRVSPKFDWANHGRDKEKLATLIKREKIIDADDGSENLTHQIFIRGQWLKRELYRLQEENNNLKAFLERSKVLAVERRAQDVYVPRMLANELKSLEKKLEKLKKIYKKKTEIIQELYVKCRAAHK